MKTFDISMRLLRPFIFLVWGVLALSVFFGFVPSVSAQVCSYPVGGVTRYGACAVNCGATSVEIGQADPFRGGCLNAEGSGLGHCCVPRCADTDCKTTCVAGANGTRLCSDTSLSCCNPVASESLCSSQNSGNAECRVPTSCSATNTIAAPSGGFLDCTGSTTACCATTPLSCVSNLRPGYSCNRLADCESGTSLGLIDCTGGNTCCKKSTTTTPPTTPPSGGTCESTSGQICSADCGSETGYEAGGTGTCTDSAKSQCCKPESDPEGGTIPACTGSENPGLVPCGRSCDNPATPSDETAICTLCHLLLLIKNIFDWIFMVMTYIAFAVLVAMGILYIVSTGRPQLINVAKSGIWAALVGFAVVLLAWVMVNVVLFVLADGALGEQNAAYSIKDSKTGAWFEFTCDAASKYQRTGLAGSGGSGGGAGSGGAGGGPGNGSCSVISSGYCTTENLGKACSWNAEAASKVCNVESGGNTAAASNTDRCQNENGDRFSFGLFQLNIIANGCMLGDDCCWQNVFSLENGNAGNNGGAKKRCTNSKGVSYVCGWGCAVVNRSKYTECSQRAMDAAKNISAACTLYKQSGWQPWPVTRKRCGL